MATSDICVHPRTRESSPRAPEARRPAFKQTLKQVIGESRRLAAVQATTDPDDRALTDAECLEEVITRVAPEHLIKLWMLASAGQVGKEISDVCDPMPSSKVAGNLSPLDVVRHGINLEDHLLRGTAIALATGLDLEGPLKSWCLCCRETLDERAWGTFARQLAQGNPSDWQALSVLSDRQPSQVVKVYLRLAGKGWWSFQTVLDRPSSGMVELLRKRLRSRIVVGESLWDLARLSVSGRSRALVRALRAIRARVGPTANSERRSRHV